MHNIDWQEITVDWNKTYPVMEHFYTLQGEGSYAGHAAYFIRLAGCDVGCVWCDVKESWEEAGHPIYTVKALTKEVLKHPGRLVVITGGEPTLHDLTMLTAALKQKGCRIHIETSGSSSLSGQLDWITLSPKKFKAPLESALQCADEFKVVVFHKSDFNWAEQVRPSLSPNCKLYLQTEWSKKDTFSDEIVSYIKEHPEWHLSMQTHKYLQIP